MLKQNSNTLLLASKSRSRRMLLDFCKINYKVISQDADESKINLDQDLKNIVTSLAKLKMQNITLPESLDRSKPIFILTADTLGMTYDGKICTKPKDKADAIDMLKKYKLGATTATGFCLEKRAWNSKSSTWEILDTVIDSASASYKFIVPDKDLDSYLNLGFSDISFLDVSGAVEIERFGVQYLDSVKGSYSSIVGLPMFELRKALEKLNFFN